MSHDQKPARIRIVGSGTSERRLGGGFATGPAPRRAATPRASDKTGIGRVVIAFLFLSAALVGGVVQAWLLMRA
ncbi:hypothetical protein [Sphingomonas sp.]|uniref:hypothetical protein n=1 Tax=Sphingomonas sp. TaxID=28214 RepID=UPI0017C26F93|nr:hypothetical protein [Sphingomonas sp.]MBA4761507.1 hypothetical protein [Sphingomonas sp.]